MIMIESKDVCCGCAACAQSCVKQCVNMTLDDEGFLYPEVDKGVCVDCGACNNVCPIENPPSCVAPKEAYALVNGDDRIVLQSSSGGAFRLLSDYVLDKQR